jgi:galactose-1-phosphate uridylyltransferase
MNDGNTNKLKFDHQSSEEDSWQLYLQSRDVQEVRQELIEKYLSLGRSQEYAETEIDKFLNDPSRSQKFLEMKKYVKSQEDASMGFENFLLYGGAFFVGLLGDAIFKYIVALQEEITSDHIDLFHFPS